MGDPNLGPGRLHWLILDVGVTRPNQAWKWPRWVALTPGDLRELAPRLRDSKQSVWTTTPEITNAFRSLADCVRTGDAASHASRIIIQINMLLVAMLDALRKQETPEGGALASMTSPVELFFEELTAHPAQLAEPWTLLLMAKRCGMGTTAFVKYCRIATNTSPLDFLNRCRLDRAVRLLRLAPAMSVTEIAFECGYSSSQYFATQFRRRYGHSPSGYRNDFIRRSSPRHS